MTSARKVGNCRIIRELGRGGMGVVYEAEQEDLMRRVAIKELPSAHAQSSEAADRFRREGIAYARLNHQAIIAVYDLVEKNDAIYLITEFVDGADLAKILQKGALPPSAVAVIGGRVAQALDHAHFHKLLHRDVKPANIMVSRTGSVKLTDFGIAKDLDQQALTRDGMVVGSLPYMAPEVLSSGDYNPRSDIWSLGVTLFELATGKRPFQGKDDGTLIAAIVNGKLPAVRKLAPHVPRSLAKIIERCLERKPGRRYQSAAALGRALDVAAAELLDGAHPRGRIMAVMRARGYDLRGDDKTAIDVASVMQASPERGLPGRLKTAARIFRRRRYWLALAVWLMLVLSAVGAAWIFWRPHRARGAGEIQRPPSGRTR